MRGVEQRCEGRTEPLEEVTGQPRECRIARVQRRGESAFGREQFGEPLDPSGQCFGRLVCGTQCRARSQMITETGRRVLAAVPRAAQHSPAVRDLAAVIAATAPASAQLAG